jgi:hypothetical protein
MERIVKGIFGIHAIVAFLVGAPLLIAPGRFLVWVGWRPIDPLGSRMLGAALLALAWTSFRAWREADTKRLVPLVEMELVFTVLGSVGFLRHLLFISYPWFVWFTFAVLALFTLAWAVALLRKKEWA